MPVRVLDGQLSSSPPAHPAQRLHGDVRAGPERLAEIGQLLDPSGEVRIAWRHVPDPATSPGNGTIGPWWQWPLPGRLAWLVGLAFPDTAAWMLFSNRRFASDLVEIEQVEARDRLQQAGPFAGLDPDRDQPTLEPCGSWAKATCHSAAPKVEPERNAFDSTTSVRSASCPFLHLRHPVAARHEVPGLDVHPSSRPRSAPTRSTRPRPVSAPV